MNGKDYIIEAIDVAERVIEAGKTSGRFDDDPFVSGVIKACEDLVRIKNKPTLRTRSGANLAFPVCDAARKIKDAFEEDDMEDLHETMEAFSEAVDALGAALKERTVIMT